MQLCLRYCFLSLLTVLTPTCSGFTFSNVQPTVPIQDYTIADTSGTDRQIVRIAFWNVENLYDPFDDTTKLDDEFTKSGLKKWSWGKFMRKLNHVAKTILAIGKWAPPPLVGLCEVENRYVLNKLIYETPLKPFKYKFIHHESPDMRGVDVALLYRPDVFRLIASRSTSIRFPFDTVAQTREILMVKGTLFDSDTIVLLINHWPSRRGGNLASQPRRNYVARVLRGLADSVQHRPVPDSQPTPGAGQYSNIVIMGDFNDEPFDASLVMGLGAKNDTSQCEPFSLYNLMGIRNRNRKEGTLKYRDQWSTFDQFIISGTLLKGISGIAAGPDAAGVFSASFLMEEDNTWFGEKLNRTYTGPRYNGGFSDHLPVYLDIRNK